MKTIKLTDKFELYHQYPFENSPQSCYVELDLEDETLTAESNPEIGNAVPFHVWHGHARRYGIPPLVADYANDLLDEIAPLAMRVIAGYSRRWDGHNYVAYLDDDAIAAEYEIERICEREADEANAENTVASVDASDWLYTMKDEVQGKTDAELEALAVELEAEAEAMNLILDALDTLKRWRDESQEEAK